MAKWYERLPIIDDLLGATEEDRANKAKAAVSSNKELANNLAQQQRGIQKEYLDTITQAYNPEAYNQALANLQNYTPNEFSFNNTVDDYFSKFYNQDLADAQNAIKANYSQNGNIYGSNYMDALMNKQKALAASNWQNAYQAYLNDKQQQLAQYNNQQDSQLNHLKDMFNIQNNARSNYYTGLSNYYNNMNSIASTQADNLANANNANAQIDINRQSLTERLFSNPVVQFAGNLAAKALG